MPQCGGLAESPDQLHRMERERLYPSITNPNWLVLRSRREIFRKWLQQIVTGEATVLDVGGRIQPYRPLITGKKVRYFAVDILRTALVNITARAEQLPLPDGCFDIVLCTQMLEYAPEPGRVIAEIYRVLNPGGYLLLSVSSLSIRHVDEECWRFWPAGLRHLLSTFADIKTVPEVGSIAGLFRTVNVAVTALAKYSAVRAVASYTLVPALNLAGLTLENLLSSNNDVMAVNYSVLARK
jgi:SAM-dependent methyltransferase